MNFTIENFLRQIKQSALNSFKACGYEAITVNNTIKRLTVPTDAKYALMKLVSTATGNAANYLETGSVAVTTSVGMPISDGTVFDVTDTQNLASFQIIQSQAGTHTLHVQYYK